MDLFGAEHPTPQFSLEAYHIMGSRILSRSFQVEAQPRLDGSYTPVLAHENPEMGLDVSSSLPRGNDDTEDIDVESDDDDDDDPANVAMVPMADMLNARYGCANVRLSCEPFAHLNYPAKPPSTGQAFLRKPRSPNGYDTINSSGRTNRESLFHTARRLKPIHGFLAGQWNTYGDPPNSDLLRRYGHVDQVPLADGGFGNPADIVEIRADLVMEVVGQYDGPGPRSAERLEWWLEEGGDECALSLHHLTPLVVLHHPDLPSV